MKNPEIVINNQTLTINGDRLYGVVKIELDFSKRPFMVEIKKFVLDENNQHQFDQYGGIKTEIIEIPIVSIDMNIQI